MWRSSLILLVTLTAVLAYDREAAKETLVEYRIRSQHLHLDEIEEEVTKLEHAFDKLSHPIDDVSVSRVKARIRKLAGTSCTKNEVSCGGDHPECVHNLLVCDGHKDCHNGLDEDEKVCSMDIIRVGSTFKGITHWTSCVELHDHPTLITITASHRSSFFGPRAWVRATVTNEVSSDLHDHRLTSYMAKGYFVFASRQLALIPEKDAPHRFGIVCNFTFGDYDHADCRVVTEASMTQCARLRIARS